MPSRQVDMSHIACSSPSSPFSTPSSLVSCRRRRRHFYTPATTGLSCDFVLDAVADDHPIVTDTNTTTTSVSAPPVHGRTARVLENSTHCIHGADCVDMTRQDEDELPRTGNGGSSGGGPSPSAYAAVSHYPYVEPGDSERMAMNEVINVNAVVGSERHMREIETGRRRGEGGEGASGRREDEYAVEDVGMRSLASSDHGLEDDGEEEGQGEEGDREYMRKIYPDPEDVYEGGGLIIQGSLTPNTGYGQSSGYGNARRNGLENVPYEDEYGPDAEDDYAHENEDTLRGLADTEREEEEAEEEEEEEDEEENEEELEQQDMMDTLYRMEELSSRAIEAGIDFTGAHPFEMVDMLAEFANEFPVTSMWSRLQCSTEKAKITPLPPNIHTGMHELTQCNQHTSATLQLISSSTNGCTKLTVSHTTGPRTPST